MKHTLKKDDQNNLILHRDGKPLYCPFQPPIIVNTKLGTQQIMKHPCGNYCAKFENINDLAVLRCGEVSEYIIEEDEGI